MVVVHSASVSVAEQLSPLQEAEPPFGQVAEQEAANTSEVNRAGNATITKSMASLRIDLFP